MEDSTDEEDESPMTDCRLTVLAEEAPVRERDECPIDVSVFKTEVIEEYGSVFPLEVCTVGEICNEAGSSHDSLPDLAMSSDESENSRNSSKGNPQAQSSSSESEESVDDRMYWQKIITEQRRAEQHSDHLRRQFLSSVFTLPQQAAAARQFLSSLPTLPQQDSLAAAKPRGQPTRPPPNPHPS